MRQVGMQIGAERRLGTATFESVDPYTGEPWAVVPEATKADVDDAVRAARAAFNGEWTAMTGRRARPADPPAWRADHRARRRPGGRRDAGQRQAAARDGRPGPLAARLVRVLRRAGRQDRRPGGGHRARRLLRVRLPRAGRRGRRDPAVELAAAAAHLQARARARRRVHDGRQAVGAGPGVDHAAGRALRAGGLPARRVQHRQRRVPAGRRVAGRPPGRGPRVVHRLRGDRRRGRQVGRRAPRPGHARTRRQVGQHRLPRRRPRRRPPTAWSPGSSPPPGRPASPGRAAWSTRTSTTRSWSGSPSGPAGS